jgi:predicted transport protein
VNEGLGTLDTWDEPTIQARAARLAELATSVWTVPSLPTDVLDAYRPERAKIEPYTLDDHPQLAIGQPMRPLFESLRKEILALDPCVTEEFLKLYIAYKAETNFVDVVPQAKRLRLSLNLRFHELYDPKGIAKDVTNLGRWGNGDAEVGLSTTDEIPYVMGLIRQALEKQMGNGEVDL